MQLDSIHLVLIGAIVLLGFLLAFFIGKNISKSTGKPAEANESKESLVGVKPTITVRERSIKRDKKNLKYLAGIENDLTRFSKSFSIQCGEALSVPFFERYVSLEEFVQGVEEFEAEHYESVINWFDIPKIKNNFEKKVNEIAEVVLAFYTEFIDDTPEDPIRNKYLLSKAQMTNEFNKNVAILRKGINDTYFLLNEMNDIKQQLKRQLPKAVEIMNSGAFDDVGFLARSLGAGALAVAMPLVGIPAAIANFAGGVKKDKGNNKYQEQFFELYNSYITKIDEFDASYTPVYDKQIEDCHIHISEDYIPNIMDYLNKLDQAGHSLKPIFKSTKKDVDEFEAELNKAMKQTND